MVAEAVNDLRVECATESCSHPALSTRPSGSRVAEALSRGADIAPASIHARMFGGREGRDGGERQSGYHANAYKEEEPDRRDSAGKAQHGQSGCQTHKM